MIKKGLIFLNSFFALVCFVFFLLIGYANFSDLMEIACGWQGIVFIALLLCFIIPFTSPVIVGSVLYCSIKENDKVLLTTLIVNSVLKVAVWGLGIFCAIFIGGVSV